MDKDRFTDSLGMTILVIIILALVSVISIAIVVAFLLPPWLAIVFVSLVIVMGTFGIVYILNG